MSKCNAPSIINTLIGFQLVFCEKEHGHKGDHTLKMSDGEERPADPKETIVSWNYLGQPANDTAVNKSSGPHERCNSWTRVKLPPQLAPGVLEPMYKMSLMTVTESSIATTGFSCEKSPGHEDGHKRSGIFGPLGIAWEIEW